MEVKKRYPGAGDPEGYDRIVREVFAPIYPVIAEQIVARTGKKEGHCLDVGCGTGALGRAIAGMSSLHITFLDHSPEMIALSRDYADKEALIGRSDFLVGDISRLALDDTTMDLVVSRGSVPFWNDWERAYQEILRVLKKGGHAYIGGGFGSAELRDEIVKIMNERNREWRRPFQDKARLYQEVLPTILEGLPAAQAEIIEDESGFWVHIIK